MVFHYLRIALRNMIRQPGYDGLNVIGLAIGITCCMLILLYIQNELSYDRFHKHADRIYRVVNGDSARTPPAAGPTFKELFPEVEDYARTRGTVNIWMMSYKDNGFYERNVYRVSKDFFNVFAFPLLRGNPRTALDDAVHSEQSVVISESMAMKLFGDEDPMDKVILADDEMDLRVTGVMEDVPPNSHFAADYLVSENIDINDRRENYRTNWFSRSHFTYILLAEGTDPVELEDKIAGWASTYEPLQFLKLRGSPFNPRLQPVTDIHLRSNLELDVAGNGDIGYVYVFSVVAFSVVLIACINFMNLATARSTIRAKEVAIRKTVGATRSELVLQYMGESMCSAGLAFLVATGLLMAILPWFNTLMGTAFQVSYLENPELLLWLTGIALLVGLLSGSYPALFLSRFHPTKILKGEMTVGVTGSLLRKGLVVAQFTLSILLIISTATVYQQLDYMQNRQLGFDKDQVAIIPLIGGAERGFNVLKERLLQRPSILAVTRSRLMPGRMTSAAVMPVFPTRLAEQSEDEKVGIPALFVSRDFEETLGLRFIAGRPLSSVVTGDSLYAVVLNRSAALRMGFTEPRDIVGRHMHPEFYRGPPVEIVGVVEDFNMQSLHNALGPMQLISLLRGGGGQAAIRLQAQNIPEGIKATEETWASVFPHYPLAYSFLDEDFEQLYQSERRTGNLLGAFSFLAIFIACLGLFGLAAFTTQQRTKEVGIHKVMGASVIRIVAILSKDFLVLVAIAVPVAWGLAYWIMSNWLQNFAYRVEIGPEWFLIAAFLALVIALATVSVKAVSTALTNPVESLRSE